MSRTAGAGRSADHLTENKRALLARKLQAQGQARPSRPGGKPLHRRFEDHAARRPDALAVAFQGQSLTYAELNARANRLARLLRARGVGPETLVGLCAERSIGLVVGLLAILKAGGAYVPLDPVYPKDRLALMLADSAVRVLLTEEALLDRLPAHAAEVLTLDADLENAMEDAGNLPGGAVPENLAYVIYTSGSTGRPKGVPVTHANVGRLLDATRPWFRFGPDDVWTLFHSFAFDFSVWEIWGALARGGQIVVVPYWASRSPEATLALLRERGVTVLNQTPSAFRQLIRAEEAAGDAATGDPLALRLVIFGGEALELQGLRPWFDRHGDRSPRLVNMYGITETTVHVTYRPVTRADLDESAGSSPIGRPIPDLRLYLLDRHMQPVPVGVAGEIYVGGQGLARGYLDRPALTASRFLPDPFGPTPGGRLYKSGDLARRRPDGDFEYLGRADDQVKVRGHRVELGEIEAALGRHPAVREAVVVPREDTPGDLRLVAYVVAKAGSSLPAPELRARLKEELPQYMVPSAFVVLDALPLTPHGKVDRKALPAPGANSDRLAEGAFVAPRTPAEATLAAIWANVLGLAIDRVGVHDDFFDLGGHSLLATQVASRLRDAFGVEVPLRGLFEARTVAGLAGLVEAGTGGQMRVAPPIRQASRAGNLPLSFAQQALWFLDQLEPGRPTFNVAAALRVAGPLDATALGRAFDEILRRHEALRTTFATVEGRPVQVIAAPAHVPIDFVDLTDRVDPVREAQRLAIEEARRPFDLARGPLVRAGLLRLGADEHAVLLTMHHIVTDGWSMGVAAQELATLYGAFREGQASPLPDPAIQYADYAAWQRDWLRGEVLDDLLGYWTRQLAGVPTLELPTDRPRPAVRGSRGATRPFTLPAELAEGLHALARREGVTPFMVLLAAFQALLLRYSGQDDFAVGTPIANRNKAETEGLIGYFVNMLALRTDLSGDPSFLELLGRVRDVAFGAFEHQNLPLEAVVEALPHQRDPARTPLFQVMFVLQNNRMPDVSRADLALAPLVVTEGTGTAKFDLTLALEEFDGEFLGSFESSTDLFDIATIDRMIGHFRSLLGAAVAHPATRLSELPLLGLDERKQVVSDWNQTASAFPMSCIHHLFEAQAAQTPDAVALAFAGGRWSYRELNERANRLAHVLKARGVGPETLVGIAVERSPEMAAGLLGILKAGGAYVPLDPAYPAERLAFLAKDSGVALLLTQTHLRDRLPACVEVICLDSPGDPIGREPATNLDGGARPGNPAYVLYTSGSTGTPKGVVVEHRGLVNHATAAARLFGLDGRDRVLQFSTLSFDIAVEELFPAWITGAAVVLRGGDETLDPSRFTRWIEREGITVLDLPTAYWHAWVEGMALLGEAPPESLRLVVVGGEKAQPSAFARWRGLASKGEGAGAGVRWLNTYGPTEATVIATAHEPAGAAGDLPIGRPIANARVYLLDAHLRPVPIGLPGEVYIGGAGVARGYLGRPALTAERFLPDPFGDEPGGRLFRTGDRARWRPDGVLEFLGRVDHQAKVRGFRVEPGEVEAALLAHPEVRAAVVLARQDEGGDGRLDAFVVPRADAPIPPVELRRFLGARLPRHMIPSTFTALGALPMTPSGKVDRRALVVPEPTEAGPSTPPRDAVEAQLAAIWEDLLDVRPVGVHDDFFDLGGHSLLAVRLLARVEAQFGQTLPLSSLFLGATIEDLAGRLRGPAGREGGSPLVAIQPQGAGAPFFCVHPAGGIVYCFRDLARQLGKDRPFYAFQAHGLDGDREPLTRLDEMAACYVEALRAVQEQGPYHLGGWSLGGLIAFEMAQQLQDAGQEVATLALFDTQAPDPGRGRDPAVAEVARQLAELGAGVAVLGVPEPGSAHAEEDALVLAEVALEMADAFGGDVGRMFAHLQTLSPEGQRDAILAHFEIDQVYRDDVRSGPERVARLWNVLRAGYLAGVRYVPRPYPGRIAVFVAGDRRGTDPSMGWGRLAAVVATHVVPGNHASILKAPGVLKLAEALRAEIGGPR